MKWMAITWFSLICSMAVAQTMELKLTAAVKKLEADAQFKNAIISLYVADSKDGNVIFDKHGAIGLVPASCQKIITSAAAFELLGSDYHFKTELAFDGVVKDSILSGNCYLVGYGDPTLGSWRWSSTNETTFLKNITAAIENAGIKRINGNFLGYDKNWESNSIPGGWVWEDIGNYYGAGAFAINWRENQYNLTLKAGKKLGDIVEIIGMKPKLEGVDLSAELTTGAAGSGDHAYVYLPPYSSFGFVRGTIPFGENSFVIAGAMPDPGRQLITTVVSKLQEKNEQGILYAGLSKNRDGGKRNGSNQHIVGFTHLSPVLDSINYWFLKKSINLYGEAFVKAIAFEKEKFGTTQRGIELIKDFWSRNGIEPSALNIKDGSGLSPSNRVTTKALVTVLQYAKQQKWFPSFYRAFPEMNGIKMKDGYIGDVRSYTGYVKCKNGTEYTFSFIVNNFNGNATTVREKMWQVLNLLK